MAVGDPFLGDVKKFYLFLSRVPVRGGAMHQVRFFVLLVLFSHPGAIFSTPVRKCMESFGLVFPTPRCDLSDGGDTQKIHTAVLLVLRRFRMHAPLCHLPDRCHLVASYGRRSCEASLADNTVDQSRAINFVCCG